MIEKKHDYPSVTYGSVKFNNFEFGKARGLFSSHNQRLILDGKFSVNIVSSVKFGKEIHLQVYGQSVKKEPRNEGEWSRTEIYFTLDQLDGLIFALERVKKEQQTLI